MAEDEEEAAVVLGEGDPVEGAPLARISARLMWGIEREEIVTLEGDTLVRTPEGPRELGDILAAVDQPYFATQREFEQAVRAVIGTGPIPTAGGEETEASSESATEAADTTDEAEAVDSSSDDEAVDSSSDEDEAVGSSSDDEAVDSSSDEQ